MKSIMEEGSSIVKAVEKAWTRAGKPQEFSVKVFEEAKKNFFGFTSKSAKIAIFFDEKKVPHVPGPRKEQTRDTVSPHRVSAERSSDMRDRNNRYERSDRNDRSDRNPDRNDRHDRYENNERRRSTGRDHSSRDQSSRAHQRPERTDRPRSERPERIAHHAERSERAERPERIIQAEQTIDRAAERERVKAPESRPSISAVEAPVIKESAPRQTAQQVAPEVKHVAQSQVSHMETSNTEHVTTPSAPLRWTPEMVQFAQNWMNHVFSQSGYTHPITLTVSDESLFFTLPKTVMADKEKEQALFRNCSHLIMAALRNSFDNDFRDMKVVIASS